MASFLIIAAGKFILEILIPFHTKAIPQLVNVGKLVYFIGPVMGEKTFYKKCRSPGVDKGGWVLKM